MDADGFHRQPQRAAAFADETADVNARTWFEAPTAGGPLRLAIDGVARHAVDAAIALDTCADLLDALDEWMGTALAWRWVARPLATTAESHGCAVWHLSDARAADGESGGELLARPQLELPWLLLRGLGAPPPALARQLQWFALPIVLAIDQLRISTDELALLEPGGAVILSGSLQPEWTGALRALEEPARPRWGVPVRLQPPQALRTPIAGTVPVHADAGGCDRPWCEVRLGASRALSADRLAGWYEGDLGDLGNQASLWRCATDREAARPLATGTLMPWGSGWALAIEAICEPLPL